MPSAVGGNFAFAPPVPPAEGAVWTFTGGRWQAVSGGLSNLDSLFAILNAVDQTKQFKLSLGGLAASAAVTLAPVNTVNGTLTIPSFGAADTLATLGVANAFTAINSFTTSGANNLTVASTAGNASLRVNSQTGGTSDLAFQINGTTVGQVQANASFPFVLRDTVNAANFFIWTAGTLATGFMSFAGTLSASSTTAGAAVFGNGTAATSVAIGAGIVWAGGVLRTNSGIGVLKNGSDTFNSGGTIALNNAGNTDGMWLQNSASNHLDVWGYVASVATRAARLTNTGNLLFGTTTDDGVGRVQISGAASLLSVAAPGSPTLGNVWNDSTRQGLMTFAGSSTANGIKQCLPGVLFTGYLFSPVVSTAAETSILAGGTVKGTTTLPANFLTTGKLLRFTLRGQVSNLAAATLNIKVKLGTVVLAQTGVTAITGTLSAAYFEVSLIAICTGTGVGGGTQGDGNFSYDNGATLQGEPMSASPTVDTTASAAIDITATWGASSASNSIVGRSVLVEVLN